MRILFEFTKGQRLRFVSLLDMQRLMQRALRRSGLPIKYSEGFSPHAVMSFASALGTGVSSTAEILDVKMESECPLSIAFEKMNAALPADMSVTRVARVDDSHPASMALVRWADYDIILPAELSEIAASAEKLLAENSIMAMRKTKSGMKESDIRPMIGALSLERGDGQTTIHARLQLCEKGTLKPELLLAVAAERIGRSYESGSAVIIRRALLTGDAADAAEPIMNYNVLELYP